MRVTSAAPLLLLAFASSLPAYAAQRAFVSSTGNDANAASGCILSAPCRSFQAAHSAVDAAGEIVALDTAGYGAVTITKSVTIMSIPGVVAGIAVSTGNGVTIATPGVSVVLRALNINNVGMGAAGIDMSDGAALVIENCVISRFGFGAVVNTAAKVKVVNAIMRGNSTGMQITGGATADIVGSHFLGNTAAFGLSLHSTNATVTTASVTDSVASDNTSGFVATNFVAGSTLRLSCTRCTASNNSQNGFMVGADMATTADMVVSGSTATFNGQSGLRQVSIGGGAATLASLGNNTLYANAGGDTNGTITPLAGQ